MQKEREKKNPEEREKEKRLYFHIAKVNNDKSAITVVPAGRSTDGKILMRKAINTTSSSLRTKKSHPVQFALSLFLSLSFSRLYEILALMNNFRIAAQYLHKSLAQRIIHTHTHTHPRTFSAHAEITQWTNLHLYG